MPRHAKGPRLHRHVNEIWNIRDNGGVFKSTGTRNRREAERSLARYIAEKDRPSRASFTRSNDRRGRRSTTYGRRARTDLQRSRADRLCDRRVDSDPGKPSRVSSIAGEVCRRYARTRDKAPGTIRKELGVLQAALNYCHAEGYLTIAPKVRLPAKPAPRDRWLTRDEAARLLRGWHTATRGRSTLPGSFSLRFTPALEAMRSCGCASCRTRRAAGSILRLA